MDNGKTRPANGTTRPKKLEQTGKAGVPGPRWRWQVRETPKRPAVSIRATWRFFRQIQRGNGRERSKNTPRKWYMIDVVLNVLSNPGLK